MGYIRKFLLLFSPGCFSEFEKNVWGGGGLGAGPQVFCWYAKANLGRFLKYCVEKTGAVPPPPPGPAADISVIKLTIDLPNVGLMLAQCRRRWTNNKVTLGKCLRY